MAVAIQVLEQLGPYSGICVENPVLPRQSAPPLRVSCGRRYRVSPAAIGMLPATCRRPCRLLLTVGQLATY